MKTNMIILILLLIVLCIFSVISTGSGEKVSGSALDRIYQALQKDQPQLSDTSDLGTNKVNGRWSGTSVAPVLSSATLEQASIQGGVGKDYSIVITGDDFKKIRAGNNDRNSNDVAMRLGTEMLETEFPVVKTAPSVGVALTLFQVATGLALSPVTGATLAVIVPLMERRIAEEIQSVVLQGPSNSIGVKINILHNTNPATWDIHWTLDNDGLSCTSNGFLYQNRRCIFPDGSFCAIEDYNNGYCTYNPQIDPKQQCAATNGVYDSSNGKCYSQAEWQAVQQSIEQMKRDQERLQQEAERTKQYFKKLGECARSGGTWIDQGNNNGYCQPTQTPEQQCQAAGGTMQNGQCIIPMVEELKRQQKCLQSGGTWVPQPNYNGYCQSQPTAEQQCQAAGGIMQNGQCIIPMVEELKRQQKCLQSGGTWVPQPNYNGYCQPAQNPDNMPVPAGPVNIVPAENVLPPVNDEGQVPAGPVEL